MHLYNKVHQQLVVVGWLPLQSVNDSLRSAVLFIQITFIFILLVHIRANSFPSVEVTLCIPVGVLHKHWDHSFVINEVEEQLRLTFDFLAAVAF